MAPRPHGTNDGAGRNGACASAGAARKRIWTVAGNGYSVNYTTDTCREEVYRDSGKYWEDDNKDFAAWGYDDCNGYQENSKDFAA